MTKSTELEIESFYPDQEHLPNDRMLERSNLYKIIWICQGEGALVVDLKKFIIEKETAYIIMPGQLHFFYPFNNIRGHMVRFSPDMLKNTADFPRITMHGNGLSAGSLSKVRAGNAAAHIRDVLALMVEEHGGAADDRRMTPELFGILMLYLLRNCPECIIPVAIRDTAGLAETFYELLDKNYKRWKTVGQYAGAMNCTANHLNHIMNQASGFNAKYHIQHRLLLEAKRQMVYLGCTAKETAYDLGFEDRAYFSRFFKCQTGSTYREFSQYVKDQLLGPVLMDALRNRNQ